MKRLFRDSTASERAEFSGVSRRSTEIPEKSWRESSLKKAAMAWPAVLSRKNPERRLAGDAGSALSKRAPLGGSPPKERNAPNAIGKNLYIETSQ
jgi:hypothetical protein